MRIRVDRPGRSPGGGRSRRAVAASLAGLLAMLPVSASSGARGAAAASPEAALTAYLRAVYARDYAAAYDWVSAEDRTVKTREDYVRENGAFSGAALELSRALASLIRFRNLQTKTAGDRATVTLRAVLPDANAPAIQTLLLEFDEERLAALSPAARTALVKRLREMARTGRLPTIVGENEQWELVRGAGGWRVSLNWAGAVAVRFEAETKAGLPWAFAPVQPLVRAIPGETLRTYYRARNLSDHETTGKARHVLEPPEDTGALEIISCFCFLRRTLKPGEEDLLPVVFRVSYDLPASIKEIRVRYEFYPLDQFPERAPH